MSSRSPHKTFSPYVGCVRYARMRFLLFRRPRRGNRIRLVRQPPLTGNPTGRQVYLYLHRPRQLWTLGTGTHNRINENGENCRQAHYSHCDQIGMPREMTDMDGNLLWFGNYTGWSRLKKNEPVYKNAHQPFHCRTNMLTVKQGCTTTSSGITSLSRGSLWIRTRLGCLVDKYKNILMT